MCCSLHPCQVLFFFSFVSFVFGPKPLVLEFTGSVTFHPWKVLIQWKLCLCNPKSNFVPFKNQVWFGDEARGKTVIEISIGIKAPLCKWFSSGPDCMTWPKRGVPVQIYNWSVMQDHTAMVTRSCTLSWSLSRKARVKSGLVFATTWRISTVNIWQVFIPLSFLLFNSAWTGLWL